MRTTEAIRKRLETTEDLRSIVHTMKALATVSIRQYEDAVASLAQYARSVDLGMQALLHLRPDALGAIAGRPAVRPGAIVFGSDQGLCGAFNEQIAARFLERRASAAASEATGPVLAVGTRVAARLEDGGASLADALTLPVSAPMIAPFVGEMLGRIEAWRAADELDGVHLYFNRSDPRTIYRPHDEALLPIDTAHLRALAATPWRPRALPALATDWETLFSAVVREHLFVTLHRAIAESLASEHAARRAAMHAAERNIDDRLAVLRGELNQHRQSSITSELLDIVSGYEVLRGERRNRPGQRPARSRGRDGR
jgi:F-type H+-transporting ATPase subunit gamma